MRVSSVKYIDEIVDFVSAETLKAIDWGILDLSHIKDIQLKSILLLLEDALTVELERNYRENTTGIFRVSCLKGVWYYTEREFEIHADSLKELEMRVKGQNKIWYVFDEYLIGGKSV
ncbi:hypothetical protein [Methanobrevibacter sp.]|uniref:hypothetical protein n=1 Tax=Methanobrevibacter sp. TaxID=66852 RepID=UPI00388DD039